MKEEVQPPYTLGNLIIDLNLKSIISSNDMQLQSLSFLPSNQFGSKFLSIVYHSYLYQYLTLYKVFDRELNCDILNKKTESKITTNKCMCQNYDPFTCYFYIVVVLAPVHQHSNIVYIIQIIIEDINDNHPQFPKNEIHISIPEDAQTGTRIPLPLSEDQDWHMNSLIRYKLNPSDTFNLLYLDEASLNRSLFLTVKSPLDREKAQTYKEIIVASDRGIDVSLSMSLTVHITIIDVNDCTPTFKTSDIKPIFISEDINVPQLLITVNATDLDTGDNGQITYSLEIQPNLILAQTFSINPTNGNINIVTKPDREKQAYYTLTVWAQDHGSSPKSSSIKIYVNIIDINDNDPIINGPSNPECYENNKTPLIISTYRITDPDINHNISCSLTNIEPRQFIFVLEKSKSLIQQEIVYHLLSEFVFDRESKSTYNLTLICRDGLEDSSRYSGLFISLTILDMNDNIPEFDNTKLRFSRNESYMPEDNEFITQVTATDKDMGNNAQIEYFLIHSDQLVFTVHLLSGKLFQINALDYEKGSRCLIIIGARDCGQPSFTSSLTLTFDVLDINDNSPQYNGPTTVFITENNLIGTVLEVLNISDKDSGLSGTTSSTLLEKYKEFSLVENQLVALITFDREVQNEYIIRIEMKDFGEPALISIQEIVVQILDVNDNSPVIISSLFNDSLTFPYNKYNAHQKIFQVIASDLDSGLNSTLRYFIEPPSELIQVDLNTGWISLKGYFTSNNIGNFSVNLVVRDCGINVLETNKMIHFIILQAESISWSQIKTFLFIHKWIFLTFFLAVIIIGFLIVSVYFSRDGRFSHIQKNIHNKKYIGLNSISRNDLELQMINQKYLLKCDSDLVRDCLYNIQTFQDQNDNDLNYNNGIMKNLNVMVHNSAVSNSDSGHGESAESRLLIDALPHIEVIPRQQSEMLQHRPIQYTIDWKNQRTPSLENLRLPESNSIGILNSISDEERYENMNFEL